MYGSLLFRYPSALSEVPQDCAGHEKSSPLCMRCILTTDLQGINLLYLQIIFSNINRRYCNESCRI